MIIQYVGFEVGVLFREYFFNVREVGETSREFTLTIPIEAFGANRVRLQDAPDLCSGKLRRELAAYANHPPVSHFSVSNAEIEDYRATHARKSAKR